MITTCPYGPMDKAPVYGTGDSRFEPWFGHSIGSIAFPIIFWIRLMSTCMWYHYDILSCLILDS